MDPQLIALLPGLAAAGGLGAFGGVAGVRAYDARKAGKEKELNDYVEREARRRGFRPPLNPVEQAVADKNNIIQGKDREIAELTHKLKLMKDTAKGMENNLGIAGNGVSMFKDISEQNKKLNDSLTQARNELNKLQSVQADNKILQETLKRLEMDQGKNKGIGAAVNNLGGELLTFAKNNKGLTAGLGLGAAGLAALPFLLGSSNKEAPFSEDVVVNDITKTALYKLAGYYGY